MRLAAQAGRPPLGNVALAGRPVQRVAGVSVTDEQSNCKNRGAGNQFAIKSIFSERDVGWGCCCSTSFRCAVETNLDLGGLCESTEMVCVGV